MMCHRASSLFPLTEIYVSVMAPPNLFPLSFPTELLIWRIYVCVKCVASPFSCAQQVTASCTSACRNPPFHLFCCSFCLSLHSHMLFWTAALTSLKLLILRDCSIFPTCCSHQSCNSLTAPSVNIYIYSVWLMRLGLWGEGSTNIWRSWSLHIPGSSPVMDDSVNVCDFRPG